MARRLRRRLKDAILRSRLPFKRPLARAYLRAVEARRARAVRGPDGADHGLPVPPARLRVLVAGSADRDRFLRSGEVQARHLRQLLHDAGTPIEEMHAILDFGCGCGRIARWFAELERLQVHGCDYNRELVEWCAANLPFLNARTTELEPPLPYAPGAFDFVYAFSVFTHLSVGLAEAWIAELARVVRPGGMLWFTIHGESYRERLLQEQAARFDAGEIVVWLPEVQGTNLCGAHWPEPAVRRMFGGPFDVVAHFDPRAEPEIAERTVLAHDAYLLRRV
ncbi:MAG TPA: class I SAM-dependent methyltransferase [Solirubrobacteraceae bacterium]|nr:class I SAM-dependent methyltransferase [Solirubrobacteraceae bacterium]